MNQTVNFDPESKNKSLAARLTESTAAKWTAVGACLILAAVAIIYFVFFAKANTDLPGTNKAVIVPPRISQIQLSGEGQTLLVIEAKPARFREIITEQKSKGYVVKDIELLRSPGEHLISAVFEKSNAECDVEGPHDEQAFAAVRQEKMDAGFHLREQEVDQDFDTTLIYSIWRNDEKPQLMTGILELESDFERRKSDNSKAELIDFDISLHDQQNRFSSIFAQGDAAKPFIQHIEMNSVDFSLLLNQYKGQFKPIQKIEQYNVADGEIRIAAIWHLDMPDELDAATARVLLDRFALQETDQALSEEGFYIVDLGVGIYDGRPTYSAVWHRTRASAEKIRERRQQGLNPETKNR
jgi:hypothetical protein